MVISKLQNGQCSITDLIKRHIDLTVLCVQVTWKKFDDVHPLTIGLFPFAPDTRISVDFSQRTNEWSLIIQDIRPMDEGVYQCQISTKSDHDTYDIKLNVKSEYRAEDAKVCSQLKIK